MVQKTLIRKIGECLCEENSNIRLDTELDGLEGWDSVGRLLIATLLLQTFKKEIDAASLTNCKTIGDIVNFVKDDLEKPAGC